MDKKKIEDLENRKSLKQSFIDLMLSKTASYEKNEENIIIDTLPYENCFYLLSSQFFKKHFVKFGSEYKDIRYSFMHIQDSRTGKGQEIKLMKDVCNILKDKHDYEIKYTKATDFTTSGMIGALNSEALKQNQQKNLVEGDEGWQDPVIYGDLKNYDIIFFEEAKNLLSPGKMSENILSVLQEALDGTGKLPSEGGYNIRKKLSNLEVKFNCTVSIFASTYYLQEINPILFGQGFFQRIGSYLKVLTNEETIRLRQNIIDMYDYTIPEEEYKLKLEIFCTRLMQLDSPKTKVLTLDKSAIKFLKDRIKSYEKILDETTGIHNTIMKSLSQTIIDISVKFGAINALIRKSEIISDRDITAGHRVISETIQTIGKKLNPSAMLNDVKVNRIKNIMREMKQRNPTKLITKMELYTTVKQETKMGMNSLQQVVENMISQNILQENRGEKNIKYVKLMEE